MIPTILKDHVNRREMADRLGKPSVWAQTWAVFTGHSPGSNASVDIPTRSTVLDKTASKTKTPLAGR